MSVGVNLEELLAWNDEAANHWFEHLKTNPGLLDLPCDIGGTANVQEFVRHIWGAELRWGQRLAGLSVLSKEDTPAAPFDALFNLHRQAMEVFRNLLTAPEQSWNEIYVVELSQVPDELRQPSRRKVTTHALFHSHRHYAQLATLVRQAGFPVKARGDLLFSLALR